LHVCSTTIRTGLLPFWWTWARGESRGWNYFPRCMRPLNTSERIVCWLLQRFVFANDSHMIWCLFGCCQPVSSRLTEVCYAA